MSDPQDSMPQKRPKVFISCNRADCEWAEWIAGILEGAGHQPLIQPWHFRPGENFVVRMMEAAPYRTGEVFDFQTAPAPAGSGQLFTEQPAVPKPARRR